MERSFSIVSGSSLPLLISFSNALSTTDFALCTSLSLMATQMECSEEL
jgi:hypothetical protein